MKRIITFDEFKNDDEGWILCDIIPIKAVLIYETHVHELLK